MRYDLNYTMKNCAIFFHDHTVIPHFSSRECLAGAIEHSDAPQVTCPYKDENYSCDMTLLDREIKAVSFTKTQFKRFRTVVINK